MITLQQLRDKQSYKSGLLEVQEFKRDQSTSWVANRPSVKKVVTDKTKQYLVLQLAVDKLYDSKSFINSEPLIEFNKQNSDDIVLIAVSTLPTQFHIPSLPNGYELQDKVARFDCIATVNASITDCGKLWQLWNQNKDVIDVLTEALQAKFASYLSSVELGDLIDPVDLFQARPVVILRRAATKAVPLLEEHLKTVQVDGVHIQDIEVAVVLHVDQSHQLSEDQLNKLRQEFGVENDKISKLRNVEGQLHYRRYIDSLLDKDVSFAPHTLRQTIMLFEPDLLEDFYSGEWGEAMKNLYSKVAEARNQLQRANSMLRLRNWMQIARDSGLKEEELAQMRSALIQQLTNSSEELLLKLPLYEEFFRSVTGTTANVPSQLALPAPSPTVVS